VHLPVQIVCPCELVFLVILVEGMLTVIRTGVTGAGLGLGVDIGTGGSVPI